MRISRIAAKLKAFYINFIAPQKEWYPPKKAEVLIYDASGAELLMPYLANYRVTVMSLRSESINLPCLLRAMLKPDFWKGKPLKTYAAVFIQIVTPKVVITFIDNNSTFYEISKRFPNIKTIFIQNGTRGKSGDIFESLEKSDKYHVDYMLVHGAAIGNYYLKYVTGKSIPIGSLKNNAVGKLNNGSKDKVLFISQWHIEPENGAALYIEADGTPICWKVFFEAEVKVLEFLDIWCAENNKTLQICGRGKAYNGPEKDFYADRLNNCEWQYKPSTDNYSSYKLIDDAEIVVSIDSTLGYESIGRGKKTAIFSCRGQSIDSIAANFGWPADLPNNGPFWTNNQNKLEFQRVMDYLNTVNSEDWMQTCQHFTSELMEFDQGNIRLTALLDQLLTKSESKNAN
jgi:surface carbohydrate biosynthesis protein